MSTGKYPKTKEWKEKRSKNMTLLWQNRKKDGSLNSLKESMSRGIKNGIKKRGYRYKDDVHKHHSIKMKEIILKKGFWLETFKKGNIPWNKGKKGYKLKIKNPRRWNGKDREKLSKHIKEIMNNPIIKELLSKKNKERILSGKNFTIFKEGSLHPNWLGGKSFEPYDEKFKAKFKEKVKQRDNNKCILCGSDRRLSIHHIDYNKLNTCSENCICLCNSCHSKTNKNRKYWESFFKIKLKNKDITIQMVLL